MDNRIFSQCLCSFLSCAYFTSLSFPPLRLPSCFSPSFQLLLCPFLSLYCLASCPPHTMAPAGALVRHRDWFVIYGVHKWARLIGLFKGSTETPLYLIHRDRPWRYSCNLSHSAHTRNTFVCLYVLYMLSYSCTHTYSISLRDQYHNRNKLCKVVEPSL